MFLEPEDFTEILFNAAAFGCTKPPSPPKQMKKKIPVKKQKVIVTTTVDETDVIVTDKENNKAHSPVLQLESSDMEIDKSQQHQHVEIAIGTEEDVENRMVDAATSYHIPKTPIVRPTTNKVMVDAASQMSNRTIVSLAGSKRHRESLVVDEQASEVEVLPSPIVPPQGAVHRSHGVQIYGNSPQLSSRKMDIGKLSKMVGESPISRKISVSELPPPVITEELSDSINNNEPEPVYQDEVSLQQAVDEEQEDVEEHIGKVPPVSNDTMISMEHGPRAKPTRSRQQRKPRPSNQRYSTSTCTDMGGMGKLNMASSKFYPFIMLPTLEEQSRRSKRIRFFGHTGLVRMPDSNIVGVIRCPYDEQSNLVF